MREIKFRVWVAGRFYEWGFIGDHFVGLPDTNMENLSIREKMGRSQQFTGLLDKNGKEIYEGDILSYFIKSGISRAFGTRGVVEYNAPEFRIQGNPIAQKGQTHTEGDEQPTYYSRWEIIGNVCENLGLLEE